MSNQKEQQQIITERMLNDTTRPIRHLRGHMENFGSNNPADYYFDRQELYVTLLKTCYKDIEQYLKQLAEMIAIIDGCNPSQEFYRPKAVASYGDYPKELFLPLLELPAIKEEWKRIKELPANLFGFNDTAFKAKYSPIADRLREGLGDLNRALNCLASEE